METSETPPDDYNPDEPPAQMVAIRERFVFKHQMKIGLDVDYVGSSVDVTDMDTPEQTLDRVLYGFFTFMENMDFDSRMIFDRTMDILLTARIRQENPETFGKNIEPTHDVQFDTFLRRVKGADVGMLKELYNIYIGKQSLN